MGIFSREVYGIVCDAPGCFKSTDEEHRDGDAESEMAAICDAKRLGYVLVNGKWFCPEHK